MALDTPNRLPCGVDLGTLVDQIAEGTPPRDPAHQAHCPYCQTSLGGFRQGWNDLQTLASAPVPIPPGLRTRIMTRIRVLAHHAAENIILAGSHGHTRISHQVIAQIARRVALATPGVIFASAQPQPDERVDPARARLTLRLIATYGPALRPLATTVRAALHRRLLHLTGATIDTIDITIADIAYPDAGDSTET
ncbi:MAG TPA: hypothetical protein VIX82_02520 [Solirubrobacteraceae bacterium]